jgi:hypothetical protein
MRFFEDRERDESIWIDRGVDDKVDRFEPCEVCAAVLQAKQLEDRVWQELELCHPCNTRFGFQAVLSDILDIPRPFNGMLEAEVIDLDNPLREDIQRPDRLPLYREEDVFPRLP